MNCSELPLWKVVVVGAAAVEEETPLGLKNTLGLDWKLLTEEVGKCSTESSVRVRAGTCRSGESSTLRVMGLKPPVFWPTRTLTRSSESSIRREGRKPPCVYLDWEECLVPPSDDLKKELDWEGCLLPPTDDEVKPAVGEVMGLT